MVKIFRLQAGFKCLKKSARDVSLHQMKIRFLILRLFLNRTAKDWLSLKVVTIGLDVDFETWKKTFLDSFREIG